MEEQAEKCVGEMSESRTEEMRPFRVYYLPHTLCLEQAKRYQGRALSRDIKIFSKDSVFSFLLFFMDNM